MDIAAIVISVLSLLVAGIGTYLSDKRSREAKAEAQKATASGHWSALQEAVQRLLGFDPLREPLGDRMTNLRIAMIELADDLADWEGLSQWLEAERLLGATNARLVMETAKPDDDIDQYLERLRPLKTWATVLSQNLRKLRSIGHDEATLAKLREIAETRVKNIHEQNGWGPPPGPDPHIQPLEF
ncbi:hypothetical protein [Aestuariimicrobium sp. T2.26MG-19.2B]|uniref:hypothetical protein n=1 Tax=Aestuariimicrobium sp. T2.26MG-19.2B TaxID=3040679 RepID=UPI0024777796|nr:hypothetical protein [Aestuariimicrobium sp. T2.26MG-19.2B]CAI9400377.1 hypothetical protein AESSP_00376 [Aestuariimicrobium sp. T2.26MG-19.2B]